MCDRPHNVPRKHRPFTYSQPLSDLKDLSFADKVIKPSRTQ